MSALYTRTETINGETLVTDLHPQIVRKHRAPSEQEIETRAARAGNSRIGRDCVISTEHVDSQGDILRAAGCDMLEYRGNPIVYLQHGMAGGFPVIGGNAVIEQYSGQDGVPGLIAREWLFGSSDVAKAVNADWNDQILRTASVGFIPIEFFPIDQNGKRLDTADPLQMEKQTGFEFTRWKLREWSIVAIPANQHARRLLSDAASPEHAKALRFYDLGALRNACTMCAHGEEQKAEESPSPTRALAKHVKEISLERCPECRDVVLYSRETGELFYHRSKAGPECRAKVLGFAPTGPTLRDLADSVREETAAGSAVPSGLAGEAGAAVMAILVAADTLSAGKAMSLVQERIKAGRTLSAETRRVIVGAATQAEDAAKTIVEAAAALRAYLAASDGSEDETDEPFSTVTDSSLAAALAEIVGAG